MKKNKAAIIGVFLGLSCTLPTVSAAQTLGISLNNDSAKLDWTMPLSKTAELGAGFLYSDPRGSLADINLSATHSSGIHQISLGGKLIAGFTKDRSNGQAVALGGRYRLVFSQQFAMQAQGYYAPSVLSFDSLDRYQELDARLEFKIMPTADILAGYRNVQLEYKNAAKLTFENGFYIGAQFRF